MTLSFISALIRNKISFFHLISVIKLSFYLSHPSSAEDPRQSTSFCTCHSKNITSFNMDLFSFLTKTFYFFTKSCVFSSSFCETNIKYFYMIILSSKLEIGARKNFYCALLSERYPGN
jgi:hypothetical protein